MWLLLEREMDGDIPDYIYEEAEPSLAPMIIA